jgi:hypothetical protein
MLSLLSPGSAELRPQHGPPVPRAVPVGLRSVLDSLSNLCSIPWSGGTWHDPDLGRPIAAPLEQCAELLGVDLAAVRKLAAKVEPYLRADGTSIWSLMQLERQLRPEAYGRRRAATSTADMLRPPMPHPSGALA